MTASLWTDQETKRAQQIWAEYADRHDLSAQRGQTAGIDPVTGRIWFGADAEEILVELEAEGLRTPLYFVRVGYDYYFRKGYRE